MSATDHSVPSPCLSGRRETCLSAPAGLRSSIVWPRASWRPSSAITSRTCLVQTAKRLYVTWQSPLSTTTSIIHTARWNTALLESSGAWKRHQV